MGTGPSGCEDDTTARKEVLWSMGSGAGLGQTTRCGKQGMDGPRERESNSPARSGFAPQKNHHHRLS